MNILELLSLSFFAAMKRYISAIKIIMLECSVSKEIINLNKDLILYIPVKPRLNPKSQ